MEYEMEKLVPIVAELAEKYTGCDSTSITYEKAQMLMAGVIYCLNEYSNYSDRGLANNNLLIKEQYHIGAKLVFEKTVEVKEIYNEISMYFDSYNVECLYDTVQKGLPEFLKWYDAKYCPQNTILILDYPILIDIQSLSGVDAVYKYICAIKVEQLFLKRLDRNYIIEVLERAIPEYKYMIENICEIVLLNMVGHIVLNKPIYEKGFNKKEYKALKNMFQSNSIEKLEKMFSGVLKKMIEQGYDGNKEMESYFENFVRNIAVRIGNAVETNKLDNIFVL